MSFETAEHALISWMRSLRDLLISSLLCKIDRISSFGLGPALSTRAHKATDRETFRKQKQSLVVQSLAPVFESWL